MAKNHRGVSQRRDKKGWWCTIIVNGRKKLYCCDSRSQAVALHGRLRAQIREGTYFPEQCNRSKDVTLRAWIARCLEGSSNPGTVNDRRYGRRWRLYLGKRLLSQLTTEDLRRAQTRMRAKIKPQKKGQPSGRQWSDATINRHFAFLRHVLSLAVKDGKLDRNPMAGVIFFPEAKRTRFLNDAELTSLEKIMAPTHWKLVAFAIETGLRREDQFTLQWNQVDLENDVLNLPLPKGGTTRHVPLTEGAKAILQSLDSLLLPWVFPSPVDPSKPSNPDSFVNHIYTPALRKAGIAGACWHTLRHTAASRRIMAGVDLYTVKEFLGHRDIQTTLRYAHLSPSHLKAAVNRGSLFGSDTTSDTNPKHNEPAPIGAGSQVLEHIDKKEWLGD